MNLYIRITIGILYLCTCQSAWATPPEFIVQPEDRFISCEQEEGIIDALTEWYNTSAGAIATSDSDVTITGEISLSELISNFENSLGNHCGNTQIATLRFVATNVTGETTLSEPAEFLYSDSKKPEIVEQASSPVIACNPAARDSFIHWIQAHGHAVAQDNCSDITWNTFVWNDDNNNGGTSSIENGPYPAFIGGCSTLFKISFIVEDACGNETATLSKFTILDGEKPTLDTLPTDVTVTCDQIPEPLMIDISDNCDPNPTLIFNEISNQSMDTTECNFFNYTLERIYIGSDACGNQIEHKQIISVVDTVAGHLSSPDTLIVDCHQFELDSLYATFNSGCDQPDISYRDSLITESNCETVYLRTHFLTDICENKDTVDQLLVVKDISPPIVVNEISDLSLSCDKITDIALLYNEWVDDIKNSQIEDNCNDIYIRFLAKGTYNIDSLDNTADYTPAISPDSLCNSDQENVILDQNIDIVVSDMCGNHSIYEKSIHIIDTIAPTITKCPEDIIVSVENDECTADITIPIVEVTDNCSTLWNDNQEFFYSYKIDEDFVQYNANTVNLLQDLPLGEHSLTLRVTDCARNSTECKFTITVEDSVSPIISNCPNDTSLTILNGCELNYTLSPNILVEDNCNLSEGYTYSTPTIGDHLLEYNTNQTDTTLANRGYVFNNLAPIYFSNAGAKLTMTILAPMDTKYTLFGENDYVISEETIESGCNAQSFTYDIDHETLQLWLEDSRLDIAFVPESNAVSPCGDMNGSFDGTAYALFTLSYADAEISYAIKGATETDHIIYNPSILNEVSIGAGESTITYYVTDMADNIDSCSYNILVTEDVAPTVSCRDIIIQTNPTIGEKYILDPSEISDGTSDNCALDSLYLSRYTFDCSDYGEEISVTLYANDKSGNIDSCTARVRVEPFELQPTYTSGICDADTLRLFSNIDVENEDNYTFDWSGPNGYTSTNQNPIILNASSINNGIYNLTISGFGGCEATGSVQVMIDAISTPVISAAKDTVCLGNEIVLNSTMYSGDVTYKWYEGEYPNGVLISTTVSSSTTVSPTSGSHYYYLIVDGGICESNPSNLIQIQAIEPPIAVVNDNFINICEGESFTLGTLSFGPDYNYQWTGPNGYISNKPNPEPIVNAQTEEGGQYILLISIGGCSSDTAITRVNIFEKPVKPSITADDLYCESSTLTMSVNNTTDADNYYWYLNGTLFTTTDQNSLSIENAQENLSGSWQVQVEDGICISDLSTSKEITINSLADVTATNTGPSCIGDSIQLLSTFIANAEYMWTGPDGFTSSLQNPKILAIAGEYTIEVSTSTDCIVSASTTVSVDSAPTITALSSDAEECMQTNDIIKFYPTIVPAAGDYTYLWTGPNGYTSSEQNPIITNLSDSKVGSYQLQVSNGNCFSEAFSVSVQYSIAPPISEISYSGNGCEGDTLTFSTKEGDNLTYQWATPSGIYTTDDANFKIKLKASDEGYYAVARANGSCLSSYSDSIYIEVGSPPPFPSITTNSPVCKGDTLKLSIDSQEGYTYEWKLQEDIISSSDDLTVINVSKELLDNISLRIFDGNCTSPFYSIDNVDVIESVASAQSEQNIYEFCAGNNLEAEVCIADESYVETATYTLYNSFDEVVSTTTSRCFTLNNPSLLSATDGYYIITKIGNCISTPSTSITLYLTSPEIEANILSEDKTICDDELVALFSEYGPPTVDVFWTSNDDNINISSPEERIARASGFTKDVTEIYLYHSTINCSNYSIDTMFIYKGVSPIVLDDFFDVGEDQNTININLTENDTITGDYTISIISDPKGGSIDISEDGTAIYTVSNGFNGVDNFTYEICLENCDLCSKGSVSINVMRSSLDCIAPTIITPNGDNKNDYFIVNCNTVNNNLTLSVYNEWGKEVYSSENYQNDWAGTYDGKDLPVGTYFYVLGGGLLDNVIKGFLIIQR